MEYNMNSLERWIGIPVSSGARARAIKRSHAQSKKKLLFMEQAVKVIAKQVQEAEQGSRREIHWGY